MCAQNENYRARVGVVEWVASITQREVSARALIIKLETFFVVVVGADRSSGLHFVFVS